MTSMMSRQLRWLPRILILGLIVVLAVLPQLRLNVPGVLPGPTYTPGTLQLLSLCLLIGALAVTYDLLFGLTGLLSFGHALYFTIGVYVFAIALQHGHLAIVPAALLTIAIGAVATTVIGVISLRAQGISFAMVTLAFAQAGSLAISQNFGGYTGGEEGLGLSAAKLPDGLVGVANTKHLYWVCLVVTIVVFAGVSWLTRSRAGHTMAAVRENELRVRVMGVRPYLVQLVAFVVAGILATVVGIGYLLLQDGANPQVSTPNFTLTLLVMVVLGGVGYRWGALAGGVIYTLADQRLSVLSSSHSIESLPGVLRVPLSQPLFILGTLFILVVLFLPGGLAGAIDRLRRRATLSIRAKHDIPETPSPAPQEELAQR